VRSSRLTRETLDCWRVKKRERAAILVPIELIFNEGPNDLFVMRVAVNGLAAISSRKYAVGTSGQQPEDRRCTGS
jgi:hypothetical protein